MKNSSNPNTQDKEREARDKTKKQELLSALIDTELSKSEEDLDGEALESFLQSYDAEQAMLSKAQIEQSLAKIEKNVSESLQEKSKAKSSPYKAWIALAASLLILFHTVLLPNLRVEWKQEKGGQVALEETYQFYSWEEVNSFLGFALHKHKDYPDNPSKEEMTVRAFENYLEVSVYYEVADDVHVGPDLQGKQVLVYRVFEKLDSVLSYQRNAEGKVLGLQILDSQNLAYTMKAAGNEK